MTGPALAQQTGAVAGAVRDAGTGEALGSVQLSVDGTGLQVLSGVDGAFRFEGIPAGVVSLRASRIGYQSVVRGIEVAAGQVTVADFDLLLSAVSLDALVATATGLQRRREVGNAIGTLDVARELERVTPSTLTALLQGRVPGVTILPSSGSVGASSLVRVRGATSISLGNTSLVYVDGALVSNSIRSGPEVGGQNTSRLDDLNPGDIESIEIARGPSAATLYGTEASAGVILITTKRGIPGEPEWTVSTELGANWDATQWPDNVFNPRAFLGDSVQVGPTTFVTVPDTLYHLNLLEGVGTDQSPWRTGVERAYSASLRGGSEAVTYYLSGRWQNREGNLPNNESTRRNARLNFGVAASENVDVSLSTWLGSSRVTLPDNDNNVFGYLGVALVGNPWDLPIVRDDPVTMQEGVATCPIDWEVTRAFGAPLGSGGCQETPFFGNRTFDDVATLDREQLIERFTGSATVEYRPRSFLTARGIIGYDRFSDQTRSFVPVDPDLPFDDFSRGYRDVSSGVSRIFTLQGDVSGRVDLTPDLRSVTSVGVQFSRQKAEAVASIGRFLPAGTRLVSSAVRTEGSEAVGESRNVGFYVEQQLAYRDRIFITPGLRIDDNAAFGEGLGRKLYPRVMASYVVSEEGWFRDVVPSTLVENLRLRGAWGLSGKHPDTFSSVAVFGSQRVAFQGMDAAGVTLVRPANEELKPETGREIEVGFESDLLNGRLGLDFTWYSKTSTDAIVARTLAPSSGYPGAVATNIGGLINRGVELSLYGVAMRSPLLRWDWRLNVATAYGRITKLDEPIIYGALADSQRHQEGFPHGSYFGPTYYIDEAGDVQSSAEPEYLGQPTPRWEGSFSTSATLLGFVTLYANVGFAGGHQLLNSTEQFRCGSLGGGTYGGVCPEIFETDSEGGRTDVARIKAAAAADFQHGPWVEDADYLRLRTLAARVDIPPPLIESLGVRRASLTLQADNLMLFTKYGGVDPEVSGAGAHEDLRVDFLTLPPARRITGRFEVTF